MSRVLRPRLAALVAKSNFLRAAHFSAATHRAPSSGPLESNLRRILRNEVQYLRDYAPPYQPDTNYGKYNVEDRPGEKWITMKYKSSNDETVKIEAAMFDDFSFAPERRGAHKSEDIRLHISVLIDISKEDGADSMEFVCSAWPDSLEIQKVYMLTPHNLPAQPYIGPHVKSLSSELQRGFSMFLNRRGLNDDLSKFLHSYMMNKDKIELIRWLQKVQSYFDLEGMEEDSREA